MYKSPKRSPHGRKWETGVPVTWLSDKAEVFKKGVRYHGKNCNRGPKKTLAYSSPRYYWSIGDLTRRSLLGRLPTVSNRRIAIVQYQPKREILEITAITMVGHLFQNYDTIYVRVFPTYTSNHSCYKMYVRFFATYTCVLSYFVGFLFPSIWPFSYKRAYICAQKSPYICVTNKHVVYGVTENRRIRGTELYSQQKPPSCTIELKSNFSVC